jgi:hypothetical protein
VLAGFFPNEPAPSLRDQGQTKPRPDDPNNPYDNGYKEKDRIGLPPSNGKPGGQLAFDYFEYTGPAKGVAYAHGPGGTIYKTPEVPATRDSIRGAFIKMYENNGINDVYGSSPSVSRPKPETPKPAADNPYENTYKEKDRIGLPPSNGKPGGQLAFDYFEYTGPAKGVAYAHGPGGTIYKTPEVPATRDSIRGAFIKMYENNGINDVYPLRLSMDNPSEVIASNTKADGSSLVTVTTYDRRELQVATQDGSTIVLSEGKELFRLQTPVDKVVALLQSPASPVLGQGTPLIDAPTQIAMQPDAPKRDTEQPKIGLA